MERAIEIFSTLGKVAKRIPIYAKELEPLHSEGGGSSSVSIQKKTHRGSAKGRIRPQFSRLRPLRAQNKEFLIKKYSGLCTMNSASLR
jgi:hypothetical protein